MDEAIRHLNEAIKHAEMNHADVATKHPNKPSNLYVKLVVNRSKKHVPPVWLGVDKRWYPLSNYQLKK
ncbi:small metal-binding protein SmbP [Nitrosomonas communis]|uniref:Small metal-binding protein n=1 Tax=Nitrosomonas communis TaxID=44574 RepID=A0A1H3A6I9_9PROT|nr:small metal-binding protein SmbP [Nitrosomonas communis]SDX25360.1 Small metal-binding protein [Nitrosomonas communis]